MFSTGKSPKKYTQVSTFSFQKKFHRVPSHELPISPLISWQHSLETKPELLCPACHLGTATKDSCKGVTTRQGLQHHLAPKRPSHIIFSFMEAHWDVSIYQNLANYCDFPLDNNQENIRGHEIQVVNKAQKEEIGKSTNNVLVLICVCKSLPLGPEPGKIPCLHCL